MLRGNHPKIKRSDHMLEIHTVDGRNPAIWLYTYMCLIEKHVYIYKLILSFFVYIYIYSIVLVLYSCFYPTLYGFTARLLRFWTSTRSTKWPLLSWISMHLPRCHCRKDAARNVASAMPRSPRSGSLKFGGTWETEPFQTPKKQHKHNAQPYPKKPGFPVSGAVGFILFVCVCVKICTCSWLLLVGVKEINDRKSKMLHKENNVSNLSHC